MATLLAMISVASPSIAPLVGQAAAEVTTSAMVPVIPCRLADTRPAPDGPFGSTRLDEHTVRVQAAGRCGIGERATAVVLSVVSVGSRTPGFVTVHPSGGDKPLASNLNYRAGETRANSVVTSVAAGASFDVFTTSGDLVVDVTGWFAPEPRSGPGRFVALTPRRIIDTRDSIGPQAPIPAGGGLRVPLPAGVPSDALGVSINVTVTEAVGPGFVTVHPAGTARPFSSTLNLDRVGQTRAAGAIVPVNPDGFEVHLSGGGHLVVDVNGYFTGPSAPVSEAGLFMPAASPTRLLDTRDGSTALVAGGVRSVAVPTGSAAAVFNLTSVDGNRGYVTAWPGGSATRPVVSSLNSEGGGDIAANLVVVPAATSVQLYSQSGTHLVVDLAGWFIAGTTQRPTMALTFDDGPGPFTPAILEVLARYGVAATFFMIGLEVDRRPSTAAAVVAAGHSVGNHSYHHFDLTALPPGEMRAELVTTSSAIQRAAGITPRCVRPPQGRLDAIVEGVIVDLGLVVEQGTVDAGDWRDGVAVDEIVGALDAAASQVTASMPILTLHDAGGDRSATVQALDRWLAANADRFDFRVLNSCG